MLSENDPEPADTEATMRSDTVDGQSSDHSCDLSSGEVGVGHVERSECASQDCGEVGRHALRCGAEHWHRA